MMKKFVSHVSGLVLSLYEKVKKKERDVLSYLCVEREKMSTR
jgi:hypothetical protein